jgi:hypothetical protein
MSRWVRIHIATSFRGSEVRFRCSRSGHFGAQEVAIRSHTLRTLASPATIFKIDYRNGSTSFAGRT